MRLFYFCLILYPRPSPPARIYAAARPVFHLAKTPHFRDPLRNRSEPNRRPANLKNQWRTRERTSCVVTFSISTLHAHAAESWKGGAGGGDAGAGEGCFYGGGWGLIFNFLKFDFSFNKIENFVSKNIFNFFQISQNPKQRLPLLLPNPPLKITLGVPLPPRPFLSYLVRSTS